MSELLKNTNKRFRKILKNALIVLGAFTALLLVLGVVLSAFGLLVEEDELSQTAPPTTAATRPTTTTTSAPTTSATQSTTTAPPSLTSFEEECVDFWRELDGNRFSRSLMREALIELKESPEMSAHYGPSDAPVTFDEITAACNFVNPTTTTTTTVVTTTTRKPPTTTRKPATTTARPATANRWPNQGDNPCRPYFDSWDELLTYNYALGVTLVEEIEDLSDDEIDLFIALIAGNLVNEYDAPCAEFIMLEIAALYEIAHLLS